MTFYIILLFILSCFVPIPVLVNNPRNDIEKDKLNTSKKLRKKEIVSRFRGIFVHFLVKKYGRHCLTRKRYYVQ